MFEPQVEQFVKLLDSETGSNPAILTAAKNLAEAKPTRLVKYLDTIPPAEEGAAFFWVEGDSLNTLGVMVDSDPFSEAKPKNDQTWEKGDALELFFQPIGHENYFELHIVPNQATLELSLPCVGKHKFEDLFFDSGMTAKAAEFAKDGVKGWWGHISVPLKSLGVPPNAKGVIGHAAICRYNYNHAWGKDPELSSTAVFESPGFHQPQAWHGLLID